MRREPAFVSWMQDILRIFFLVVLLATSLFVFFQLPSAWPPWWDTLRRIVLAILAGLATLAALRFLVPKPRAGSHRVTLNGDYLRFLASAALCDVAMHPVLRQPFWFLHITRVLYLRLLGARVAWSAAIPSRIEIRDPCLLTVERGAQLEAGVIVESALHGAGRVRVGRVRIGQGTLVGAHSILMPGATLGHEARLEPTTIVGEGARVGVGAAVGEGARLERSVDLGSYTVVGTGAILSEGAVIGDRARVAPGAWVEPDARVGERETWAGVPARLVQPV